MRVSDGIRLLKYAKRAKRVAAYAAARGLPGMEFDQFGRALGHKIWWKQPRLGLDLMVSPLSCVRYFEFSFARSCLPEIDGSWLDVSSPRLFSVWAASRRTNAHICMINPDASDTGESERLRTAAAISQQRLELATADVVAFAATGRTFDCIWSISVVEHIAGAYDDRAAMRAMWSMLNPGGRLIVSVPVKPAFEEEYRDDDPYGLQAKTAGNSARSQHFFQRFYDERAIAERLSGAIGHQPERLEIWGESEPGWFAEYENRWKQHGLDVTADDAKLMADHFVRCPSFANLRGLGVCGLLFSKPAEPVGTHDRKANR